MVDGAAIRLKAMREAAGLSVRELASLLDMPSSTYGNYEARYKKPYLPVAFAKNLADVLVPRGASRAEVMALAGIEGPARPQTRSERAALVQVRALQMKHRRQDPAADALALSPRYIEDLTGSDPDALAIMRVTGEAMAQTLLPDDLVMIDTAKTNTDFDGLFAFRFGEAVHIKRVARAPDPSRFIAISDNRAGSPPVEYGKGDVEVVGRVVWFCRRIP